MNQIRPARMEDLPAIMAIYDEARRFMRSRGNNAQWIHGYPSASLIESDMAEGRSFVEMKENEICAVFAFIIGEEPTYQHIDGAWHHPDRPYGTIHRLASSGAAPGTARTCFDFCRRLSPALRIDTHRTNLPMQHAVKAYGFEECGIIRVADGSERIAFDYLFS